jgi:hypothetical protein
MRVEAIQNEVARLRAIERARMLAALRRSASSTNTTTREASWSAELGRPFDAYTAANVPPPTAANTAPDLKNGLLA